MLLKQLTLLISSLLAVQGISSKVKYQDRSNVIKGQYIISLNKNHRTTLDAHINFVNELIGKNRAGTDKINHIYNSTLYGYSAKLSDDIVDKLIALPEIVDVELDGIAKGSLDISPKELVTQTDATWGLNRIMQRPKLSGTNYKYTHDPLGGKDVTVYVIDTGVNINHQDIKGRAVWGKTINSNFPNYDDQGHGSHLAGTIAGKRYGVAKSANIVAVKVLNNQNQGSWSDIIAGIEWAVKDKRGKKGNVLNMSLGGPKQTSVDRAATAAYNAGFVVAVAAMNDNKDACQISPASADNIIAVGATDVNDKRASFSNFGDCVNIFGPGVSVISLSHLDNTSTKVMSGTSMATPHVAGLSAYFLSFESLTTKQVTDKLLNLATKNAITDAKSANVLLYTGL